MKKIILVVTAFALITLGTQTAASAEDIAGRSGIGIKIANVSPDESEFDSSTMTSINYTRGISSNLSIEASIGRTVMDLEGGELTVAPILVTAQYRMPSGDLSPYLGAGIGYYLNDFDVDSGMIARERASGLPLFDRDIEFDNSFGYHINVGIDYFLNSNLAVNLDGRMFWTNSDITVKGTDSGIDYWTEEHDRDLDSTVIGVGVKYFF